MSADAAAEAKRGDSLRARPYACSVLSVNDMFSPAHPLRSGPASATICAIPILIPRPQHYRWKRLRTHVLPLNPAARQLRHVMRHLAERHGLTVTFNMIKVYRA